MNEEGLRFNEGKLRTDLVPSSAVRGIAEVLSFGAKKYAENNWRKGMKWSKVISSLERHFLALKECQDYDDESNLLHIDHILTNAAFLKEYYKIAPQFDDRNHNYLKQPKIALDLDDCIISWCDTWCKKFNHPLPKDWDFSYKTLDNFKSFTKEEIEEFYSNIPPKITPKDIEFPIHCYITARTIDENITKKWIEANGFPTRPVYTVGFGKSKVEAFKESGADWMIDDGYHNFVELNKSGICTFLLTTPHNEKFDVGYKRVKDFKDFKERFL